MCMGALEKWEFFQSELKAVWDREGTSAEVLLALCQAKHVECVFVACVREHVRACVHMATAACARPTAGKTSCRAFLGTQLAELTSVRLRMHVHFCVCVCVYVRVQQFIGRQPILPSPRNSLHGWDSKDAAN